MQKLLCLSAFLFTIYFGYAQVPNANESSFPAEGSILEGSWGTYLLQGLTTERKLRLGVSNDGYTRAEIELENNNTASGKIIFKTTSVGGGAVPRMTILNNGNIGIGIESPEVKLDVDGSLRLGGTAGTLINPHEGVGDLNPGVTAAAVSVKGRRWGHFVVDIYGNDAKDAFAVRTDSNRDGVLDNIPFLVNNAGNVGIGTTTPDAKLTVKGKIHTQEVKVDLNGAVAPDYVFEEGYDLRSLEEVQVHIKEKGHLPGVPSAEEMEEEGINLKEMNLKLLEKVEELTLYMIELKKEISELKENKK